jgi:hypothetical protein
LNFGKSWITNIVSHGYFPEWQNTPPLEVIPVSHRGYRHMDLPIFNQEVKKLLDSGAIRELDPRIFCFTSNVFIVPKETGDLRPVIDLRKLNRYMSYNHFKMENIDLVKSIIRRGDYMISIDLNQAFYHVPLVESQQPYFAFDFQAKRYCFTCLPFGLTASPRIFTKVLKLIIKMAQTEGIRLVAYLDDLLIMASSKKEALRQKDWLINQLQLHGFTINAKKSYLIPYQRIDYLGFQIDSKLMTLKLPRQKVHDLVREC